MSISAATTLQPPLRRQDQAAYEYLKAERCVTLQLCSDTTARKHALLSWQDWAEGPKTGSCSSGYSQMAHRGWQLLHAVGCHEEEPFYARRRAPMHLRTAGSPE
jgi:hypothetical protein